MWQSQWHQIKIPIHHRNWFGRIGIFVVCSFCLQNSLSGAEFMLFPALPNTDWVFCACKVFQFVMSWWGIYAGQNSPGLVANTSRTAAVIARRPSESMLILQTADSAAWRSCSSGIPIESFSAPPNLLMVATYSVERKMNRAIRWGNRDLFFNFFEDIETKRRWNQNAIFVAGALCRCEFVGSVWSADRNSQWINAGARYEIYYLFGSDTPKI